MDKKEEKIIKHYKELVENRLFDEYDILGFLIAIRKHLKRNESLIIEFADLIAHRERNQGIAMESIRNSQENKYEINLRNNTIKGYNSIDEEKWNEEWKNIGKNLEINITDEIIKEINICICSLAQKSKFKDEQGHEGILEIDVNPKNNGQIALVTTEGRPDSLLIAFAVFNGYDGISPKYSMEIIQDVVSTERRKGKLLLKMNNEIILNV